MYRLLIIKNNIERVLMLPFIGAGRLIALLRPQKQEYRVYYFFPFYHTGGAEKIHAQIVLATGGEDCIIYFTRKSTDDTFKKEFIRSGCQVRDISSFTDNKWLYVFNFIFRGIISGYINRQQKKPLVFNGQSNFGYKLSPWVNKKIPQAELIHAWNTFSKIRVPYIRFYKRSLTVSQGVISRHRQEYGAYKMPAAIRDQLLAIASRIVLPGTRVIKQYSGSPFVVLFAGRSTWEKRPALFARLAMEVKPAIPGMQFEIAGDVAAVLPPGAAASCVLHGDITDEKVMQSLYAKAHVLVIPSLSESGPLVLMEAMAAGCAILSTPVGIVPEHIENGRSGFITLALEDEPAVINEMKERLLQLYHNRDLLKEMDEHNIQYAYNTFDIRQFNTAYRELFNELTAAGI